MRMVTATAFSDHGRAAHRATSPFRPLDATANHARGAVALHPDPVRLRLRVRGEDSGMGIWVPEPLLEPEEKVLRRFNANRTQGGRAVGGRLYVTSSALRFVANR